MVKGDILPGRCLMTRGAVRAQLAAMRIILFVAGETIHGSAFEYFVCVAVFAGYVNVSFGKLKG